MKVCDTFSIEDLTELCDLSLWRGWRAEYVPVTVYPDRPVSPFGDRSYTGPSLHKLEAMVQRAHEDDTFFPGGTFMVFRVRQKQSHKRDTYARLHAYVRQSDGLLLVEASIEGDLRRTVSVRTWTEALRYICLWRKQ